MRQKREPLCHDRIPEFAEVHGFVRPMGACIWIFRATASTIEATLSHSDNEETTERLLTALRDLIDAARELPTPPKVQVPEPEDLAMLPGEKINAAVVDYLRSGSTAGMVLPDPADPSVDTIRVVAHQRDQ